MNELKFNVILKDLLQLGLLIKIMYVGLRFLIISEKISLLTIAFCNICLVIKAIMVDNLLHAGWSGIRVNDGPDISYLY